MSAFLISGSGEVEVSSTNDGRIEIKVGSLSVHIDVNDLESLVAGLITASVNAQLTQRSSSAAAPLRPDGHMMGAE